MVRLKQAARTKSFIGGFDADFYMRTNPGVVASNEDAFQHFVTRGWREGRDPSPGFSVSGYLRANPDVAESGMNPLEHFWRCGLAEGRVGWRPAPARSKGARGKSDAHDGTPPRGTDQPRQPSASFDRVVRDLWADRNPYFGFDPGGYEPDRQGWNSDHAFLSDTLRSLRPRLIVEIGVWKGGSAITMADTIKSQGLDCALIAVDTWLGSWEHWTHADPVAELQTQNGYPSLYYTFLTNVVESGLQDVIVPLPLDSGNAAALLAQKQMTAQVIHIDGNHDEDAVRADLERWWPLLEPGGALIADDYDPAGIVWPSVKTGVDAFLRATPHEGFEVEPYKCRFRKPRT